MLAYTCALRWLVDAHHHPEQTRPWFIHGDNALDYVSVFSLCPLEWQVIVETVLVLCLVLLFLTERHHLSKDTMKEGSIGLKSLWHVEPWPEPSGFTFLVTLWTDLPLEFFVNDLSDNPPFHKESIDETKARTLIEKKTAINLLEAFSVAVKHYLRGEDGIYYQSVFFFWLRFWTLRNLIRDLYYLVKFLPAYALPAGLPSMTDVTQPEAMDIVLETPSVVSKDEPGSPAEPAHKITQRSRPAPMSLLPSEQTRHLSPGIVSPRSLKSVGPVKEHERIVLQKQDESFLLPAHMPPKYGLFDLFPFSLLVSFLSERGKEVKGKKGARVRAKIKQHAVSHNLPLELSLYLVWCLSASRNDNKLNLAI